MNLNTINLQALIISLMIVGGGLYAMAANLVAREAAVAVILAVLAWWAPSPQKQ